MSATGRLKWDQTGEKWMENGNDHGVIYPIASDGKYKPGAAFNGLTGYSESPDGAEPNDIYADNIKYGSLRSAETFGFTIESYTYPDEFAECNGEHKAANGVFVGQQTRTAFGFSVRTNIANDISDEAGYKIHLIYGAKASPSEKGYETINENPDAITFSFECDTTPVDIGTIGGKEYKPTALLTIDSTNFKTTEEKALLKGFEDVLYGVDADSSASPAVEATDALLPLPADVIKYFNGDLTKAQLIEAATSSDPQ